MIIIEGPDNSGKSGIAKYLQDNLGVPIYHAGGPPKSKSEAINRAKFLLDNFGSYIFDRTTFISEPVYRILREGPSLLANELDLYNKFRSLKPIIIYCKPPMEKLLDKELHQLKEYDEEDHIKLVHDNQEKLIYKYNDVMDSLYIPPYITYDYTNDSKDDIAKTVRAAIIERAKYWPTLVPIKKEIKMTKANLIEDVKEFQEQILGNEFPKKILGFNDTLIDQTLVRLDEELEEFDEADKNSERADALVDLIYFALGALHQAGIDTARVWNEVHLKNMTKKKGITKRGDDNDASKPEGWSPPNHDWIDNVHH